MCEKEQEYSGMSNKYQKPNFDFSQLFPVD